MGSAGHPQCGRRVRHARHPVRRDLAGHRAHGRQAVLHLGRPQLPEPGGHAGEDCGQGPKGVRVVLHVYTLSEHTNILSEQTDILSEHIYILSEL